jgi:hypothetical protein
MKRIMTGNLAPSIYAELSAALHWGLRAPPRCTTEPTGLKSSQDSIHPWFRSSSNCRVAKIVIRSFAVRAPHTAFRGDRISAVAPFLLSVRLELPGWKCSAGRDARSLGQARLRGLRLSRAAELVEMAVEETLT